LADAWYQRPPSLRPSLPFSLPSSLPLGQGRHGQEDVTGKRTLVQTHEEQTQQNIQGPRSRDCALQAGREIGRKEGREGGRGGGREAGKRATGIQAASNWRSSPRLIFPLLPHSLPSFPPFLAWQDPVAYMGDEEAMDGTSATSSSSSDESSSESSGSDSDSEDSSSEEVCDRTGGRGGGRKGRQDFSLGDSAAAGGGTFVSCDWIGASAMPPPPTCIDVYTHGTRLSHRAIRTVRATAIPLRLPPPLPPLLPPRRCSENGRARC